MERTDLRFWEVKAKAKKEVIFSNAELLWNVANEYFNYCVDNPITPGKQEGGEHFKPKVQAFTLRGVCLYIGCSPKYFRDFRTELTGREDGLTEAEQELLDTINRIEEVIYLYKFNYAVTGLLNVRMIIRDLELNEKKSVVKRIIRVREN